MKNINVNTIISLIVLGVTTWAGTTLLKLTDKVTKLEVQFESKTEQLNRIEVEVTRQRAQIYDLQIDMIRLKPQKP